MDGRAMLTRRAFGGCALGGAIGLIPDSVHAQPSRGRAGDMAEIDYVVVGAGSAGAIVAARLSADPRASVLLVEAGPDHPAVAEAPPDLLDSRNLASMAYDWGYQASPVPGR